MNDLLTNALKECQSDLKASELFAVGAKVIAKFYWSLPEDRREPFMRYLKNVDHETLASGLIDMIGKMRPEQ